jgi:C1A family cysteine protease
MKRIVIATVTISVLAALMISGQLALATGKAAAQTVQSGGGGDQTRAMGAIPATGEFPRARKMAAASSARRLPRSVNLTLGNLPVGNQGRQSSCVAWAAGYYYKTYQEAVQHRWSVSDAEHRFSPSFIYNQINGGRDRGASFPDAFKVLIRSGDTSIKKFPYNQNDYWSKPTAAQRDAALPFRAASCAYIWRGAGGNDVNEIKAHLAAGDPVVLGIPVYQAFYSCRGGWVDSPSRGQRFYGNHGVCAVGYSDSAGSGKGGIKIVNSWGSSWGSGGYTYLSYRFVSQYVWEAWTMRDGASSRPRISRISPTIGNCDTTVTINGNNFGAKQGNSGVMFGGVSASVTSWSNWTITAQVPAGVGDCQVKVINWVGEVSNGVVFDVDLSLGGVAPDVSEPGKVVTINGAGLGGSAGTLKLDARPLEVVSWTDTRILFKAPASTCAGTIRAYRGAKTSNGVGFSVASSSWYLAEGCTGENFETWVLVQNPGRNPANVNITYMTPQGKTAEQAVTLPPNSRQTFNVADKVPGAWEVSTRVASDQPVIAERSMYGNGRKWGSDSLGVRTPSRTWYLAEGSTAGTFETWVLVQNPNGAAASVNLTFITPNGKVKGPSVTLPPNARKTFNVADTVPGAGQVGTQVSSELPVVAERSVYWNGRTAAHGSIGINNPAKTWYLAEGSTAGGFETWIPVINPGSSDAHVVLTYMTEQGKRRGPVATVKAGTRMDFFVADHVPNAWSVSTEVSSDQPVVAERTVYWNNRIEGHCSQGVTTPAQVWDLAEGSTGAGFETWVLVQNPNNSAAKVSLNYMTPNGSAGGPSVTLPPNSRKTFNVADTVPGQWSVSTTVTSDKPVIAERSMYGAGRNWGHDSVGSSE